MRILITLIFIIPLLTQSGFCQEKDSIDADAICVYEPTPTASFPGGMNSLYNFIEKNIQYPVHHFSGKVYIKFTVNTDGSLSNFEPLKGHCTICSNKATEMMQKMPNWIPAKENGIPVRTQMVMPIQFGLKP